MTLPQDVEKTKTISFIARLDTFIVLLQLVVDVVLLDALYVVAMVTIVAHMDHVNKGIPKLV